MGNAKTKQLPRFIQQWSQRSGTYSKGLPYLSSLISPFSAGQSPWRIALGACMAYYLLQNLFLLVGLNGMLFISMGGAFVFPVLCST